LSFYSKSSFIILIKKITSNLLYFLIWYF